MTLHDPVMCVSGSKSKPEQKERTMNAKLRYVWITLAALLCLSPAMAQESGWPRTVALDEGTVTVYEPQVDEMSDDAIRFRAALAYREEPGAEPVFGAGWFESGLQIDRFSRTAHPVGLKVTQTRFPVEADVQSALSKAMAEPGFASNFVFSLDALEASEKAVRAEAAAAEDLGTDPPKIIYRDRPALLVTIDGEPVLREIEDSPYEAVINTPYPLIRDGGRYYLNVAKDVWYRSDNPTGPYRYTDKVPEGVAGLVREEASADEATEAGIERVTAANAPEIVVTTEPAELVVTEGPAAFVPLVDDLLVLNNSDDDVFMHLGEQQYYIVLSGRWYRSDSLNGPWAYADSGQLPESFRAIPEESDQADARVFVAGTEEAEEAVLDAQVPQTAAVQRGEVDIEVAYDGEPEFAPVDGTDMVYATNTGATVIYANGLYYMVEDGVWYVSLSWDGPWQVAVARPDQVRVILPSSPVYNVKYVYVYDYTPDVVYVGYTPGYVGSYVYGTTVIYGSGYYYAPWVTSRWYYPQPRTWGFHVNYDPWYGWNFGVSWAWGPFSVSWWPGGYWHHHHYWHHRYYGYWGPRGYRSRHHHYNRHPYRGRGPGRVPGHDPRPHERHHNLYADARQRGHVLDTRDRHSASFVKSGQAKGGKSFTGSGVKDKAAYAKTGPVSRKSLADKAPQSKGIVKSGKSKTGYKQVTSVQAGGATTKSKSSKYASTKTVSRKELSQKAGSQKTAVKTGKTNRPSKTVSKQVTSGKTAVKSKTATASTSSKRVKMPSTKGVSETVGSKSTASRTRVQKSTRSPTVKSTRSAAGSTPKKTVNKTVNTTKNYARLEAMPAVRVTNPQKSTGSSRGKSPSSKAVTSPRVSSPSSSRAVAVQAPKAQVKQVSRNTASKQKSSAPKGGNQKRQKSK